MAALAAAWRAQVMDCAKHPLRKRPKTCETCARPYAEALKTAEARKPWPSVTEDGLTWLDVDGNAPKLDATGRLAETFVFVPNRVHNVPERWGAGLALPMTPAGFRAFVADIEAKRARTIKPKESKPA
jgi:hypothetical protein